MSSDTAFDVKTQQHQPVVPVHLLVGGTECDNYSALNFFTKAPESGVGEAASGKSGSTLEGFLGYIRRRRPEFLVWKKSDKTKEKDLEFIRKVLWQHGYTCMVEKLDAKSYSPQRRLRYYMVGWFSPSVEAIAIKETISDDRRDAMLSQSWLPRAFDLMHQLSGHAMQIESFLLPDDHDESTNWRVHMLSAKIDKDAKAKGGSSGSDYKFEVEHLELFSKHKLPWPPSKADFEMHGLEACSQHLPRRNQESVFSTTPR